MLYVKFLIKFKASVFIAEALMRWPFVGVGDEFRGEQVACSERRKPRRQNCQISSPYLCSLSLWWICSLPTAIIGHVQSWAIFCWILSNSGAQYPSSYPQTASLLPGIVISLMHFPEHFQTFFFFFFFWLWKYGTDFSPCSSIFYFTPRASCSECF